MVFPFFFEEKNAIRNSRKSKQKMSTYHLSTKIYKIQAAPLKQKISPKTGLPSTPNSIKIYGKIESLFQLQKQFLEHDEFLSKIFPPILKVYRAHNNQIIVVSDFGGYLDGEELNNSEPKLAAAALKNLKITEKIKILKFVKELHKNNISICNSNFETWFLNYVTDYGLLKNSGSTINFENSENQQSRIIPPETKYYEILDFIPHIDALKAYDVYLLIKILDIDLKNYNLENMSSPVDRPSVEEIIKDLTKSLLESFSQGKAQENQIQSTKFKNIWQKPSINLPIKKISKVKLFKIWINKQGGLRNLLLNLNFTSKTPGLISVNNGSNLGSNLKQTSNFATLTCDFPLTDTEAANPMLMDWNLPVSDDDLYLGQNGPAGVPMTPTIESLNNKRDDFKTNFSEVMLYSHICNAFPITKARLLLELDKKCIPESCRADIWKCLLDIERPEKSSSSSDPRTQISEAMSRQLDVDIPRCHQYNNTLASPHGQELLKKILSRWIVEHENSSPKLTYWQGLDSLCAPFVILFIDNEDLAYTAFKKFINILLPDMFKKENVNVINRYLGLLKQLLNFFDPVLGFYLHKQDFTPNLYAIPWFLTMFSHVFSLNKIYILWDRLLVKTHMQHANSGSGSAGTGSGSGSATGQPLSKNTARIFPVYVAVAMLSFISSELKKYDFSQLCQWSSDMQDFDVWTVMNRAEKMYEKSPLSVGNASNWSEAFSEDSLDQPVPFIRLQKLKNDILSKSQIQNVQTKSGGR